MSANRNLSTLSRRWLIVAASILEFACSGSEPETKLEPGPEAHEVHEAQPEARAGEKTVARPNITQAVIEAGGEVERPDILLIIVDTLRRENLGCYGYDRPTSPNVDRLAAASIRYDRAYSQAPWTTPSTAALLASRRPVALGIRGQKKRLDDDVLLLPEILQTHGYRTGAVLGNRIVGERWNFDQGYDVFVEDHAVGHKAVSSPGISDDGIRFIEENFSAGPSFLLLHYFDPHFNYVEQPDHPFYDTQYEGWIEQDVEFKELRKGDLDAQDRAYLVGIYDSEVAFTDQHVGRVLDKLEELGRFDDTLIIFTADHGEEFFDHGSISHAFTLFEEQVHVPLLIKWPRQTQGTSSGRLIELTDVAPSVLHYLGVDIPPALIGQAIQTQQEPRPAFSATWCKGVDRQSIVDGDYKLIWDAQAKLERKRLRLYNLAEDPDETMNLFEREPERAQELHAELMRNFEEFTKRAASSEPDMDLTPDEIQDLEALGYVQ